MIQNKNSMDRERLEHTHEHRVFCVAKTLQSFLYMIAEYKGTSYS